MNKKNNVICQIITLRLFNVLQSCSLKKLQKNAQLTQFC